MTSFSKQPPRLLSAVVRIALAVLPPGVMLVLAKNFLPAAEHPSDPVNLGLRIAVGVVISAVTLGTIALLLRHIDRSPMREAGIPNVRSGWRLAIWGAVLWAVPAGATFGVFALIGSPLKVTVTALELAQTVSLLLLAVLLAEAIPEEAVFRGYVTTVLGTLTRGWGVIIVQALLFTFFAALLRQNANPADLSLFLTMGIGFGYLRMMTGSVWLSIGFHAAFQTGSQLILTHDGISFDGGNGMAMLALGIIPFSVAAILVTSMGVPRIIEPSSHPS